MNNLSGERTSRDTCISSCLSGDSLKEGCGTRTGLTKDKQHLSFLDYPIHRIQNSLHWRVTSRPNSIPNPEEPSGDCADGILMREFGSIAKDYETTKEHTGVSSFEPLFFCFGEHSADELFG